MKATKIFIDCQILQSNNKNRGMGFYSFTFLQTLLKELDINKKITFYLIFNKNLIIDSKYLNIYSKNRIKILKINIPIYTSEATTKSQICKLSSTFNNYLKRYLNNSINRFIILSNFETGQIINAFPKNVTKIVLFYDLIPHLFQNMYLPDKNSISYEDYYSRFINIYDADLIITISETSRNDLINFCQLNPSKIWAINLNLFSNTSVNLNDQKMDIGKYILFPTGDDKRKNNINVLKSFSFLSKLFPDLTLVITSSFSEQSKVELNAIKNGINKKAKVVFTNNINYKELEILYKNAILVLFPSLYEGLGIPILEAIHFHKKIVCSNIPAFKEFTNNGFIFCDPYSVEDITNSIINAIKFKKINEIEYKKIIENYSKNKNIDKLCNYIISHNNEAPVKKTRIAVIGPSLTSYSAIAKYCEHLIVALYKNFKIDYFYDDGLNNKHFRNSIFTSLIKYRHINTFSRNIYQSYKHVFYNIGNSEFHLLIMKKAIIYPGICILHDVNLSGMFEFGIQNGLIENKRYKMEVLLERSIIKNNSDRGLFLISSVINKSKIVICHSNYSKNIVDALNINDVKVFKINPPIIYSQNITIPTFQLIGKLKVGIAGIITKSKGISLIKEIVRLKNVIINLFGFSHLHSQNDLFNYKNVNFKENLSDYYYYREITNNNLIITYRENYNGETSWTVLEAMKYGLPVIVKDIGWFDEIPDDCVIKVKTPDNLIKVLSKNINTTTLNKLSYNSFNYLINNYTFESFLNKVNRILNI